MRYCIPDELLNQIPYPIEGTSAVTIDNIVQETLYKLPAALPLMVKKELWHSICDFCVRTGALLERMTGAASVSINPQFGNFLRIVRAETGVTASGRTTWTPTFDFSVSDFLNQEGRMQVIFPTGTTTSSVVISVAPKFTDATTVSEAWTPTVPKYLLDKYGECIMHGALMRLYVMTKKPWGDLNLARMHAVAYNNDLNRLSFGLITSGMRKHLLIDVEDFIVTAGNGNS